MNYPLEAQYVPLDTFVLYLLWGWRFVDDIAEPMPGYHGRYSCLMFRELRLFI